MSIFHVHSSFSLFKLYIRIFLYGMQIFLKNLLYYNRSSYSSELHQLIVSVEYVTNGGISASSGDVSVAYVTTERISASPGDCFCGIYHN
jgi:hypothetical protein